MLHSLRYKLNKTWILNYYSLPLSLSPPSLPTSIPSFLPPSLTLTPSSFDPLSHTISIPFSLFFPTLLCSSTPLFLQVFARHSFCCTHSLILIKAHIHSVMAICTYLHERRSYFCHTRQLCNTCHASLTLSQFNTDNAIRQLVLDILGIACYARMQGLTCNFATSVTCTWQLFILTNEWRVQRPIAWNLWGQNVVLPVNSARPTSSVSWFVRLGSSAADDARLTLNVVWQLV